MKEKDSSVDLLIVKGTVLTLDEMDRRFDPGAIAISDSRIIAVGPSDEICSHYNASKVLEAEGCVILPGLVNAHTHAAMTLFRGLADDLPLLEWLEKYIFPAEKRLTREMVYWGSLLGCAEMIAGGITSFCDMYIFEDQVAAAARKAGMRALVSEVLYDFPSPSYGPVERGLRFCEELIEAWHDDPLIRVAIGPHALYTCSPELLLRCHELCERHNVPMVIHLAESRSEVSAVLERYGCRPVACMERLGLLSDRLMAAHCVVLDRRDMELLAGYRVNVAHQPESNMKLASGIAPIPDLIEYGVNVALGTDGCASNNDLDLFGEMDTCAKLHKAASLDPTVMPATTVLRMATVNGAKVLGLYGELGTLKEGMLADCIVVDFSKPHLTPLYDPVSHLVYAAKPGDVRHTIINGRLVMEDRTILTFDLQEVMERVKRLAKDIDILRHQWKR